MLSRAGVSFFPTFKVVFFKVPIHLDVVHFCKTVDSKCVGLGYKIPNRMDMVALYTRVFSKRV